MGAAWVREKRVVRVALPLHMGVAWVREKLRVARVALPLHMGRRDWESKARLLVEGSPPRGRGPCLHGEWRLSSVGLPSTWPGSVARSRGRQDRFALGNL